MFLLYRKKNTMTTKTETPKKTYRFKILRGGFTSGSKHKGDKMDYQPEGNPRGLPFIIEDCPVRLDEKFGKNKFQLLEPGEM